MSRKKVSKEKKKVIHYDHLYDDERLWVGADLSKPPWPQKDIDAFQKKLDSAFGAENAIILAWSGDPQYWDSFYCDWYGDGRPKPNSLEKYPILLFYRFQINDYDYYDISVPRWLLLQRLHPAQYASTWESSSWVEDSDMLSGRKRVRPAEVSPAMYTIERTIAEHDDTITSDSVPPCCAAAFENLDRICYGKYRPPSDDDLAFVRRIRENMDAKGVAQRNDQPTGAKLLQEAAASTKVYIESARRRKAKRTERFIMENIPTIFPDILERGKLSVREIEECVQEGLRQKDEKEFT